MQIWRYWWRSFQDWGSKYTPCTWSTLQCLKSRTSWKQTNQWGHIKGVWEPKERAPNGQSSNNFGNRGKQYWIITINIIPDRNWVYKKLEETSKSLLQKIPNNLCRTAGKGGRSNALSTECGLQIMDCLPEYRAASGSGWVTCHSRNSTVENADKYYFSESPQLCW